MENKYNALYSLDTIFKIILPALAGIMIKLIIMVEKEKLTFIKVLISVLIGLGFVLLLQYPIKHTINEHYQPLIYGLVAMSGETLGRFITNIYHIDYFLMILWKNIINFLSNITGMGIIFKNILSTILGISLIYYGITGKFSDWIIIFLIILGVILLFSKDTLFSRLGKLIDTVLNNFTHKN